MFNKKMHFVISKIATKRIVRECITTRLTEGRYGIIKKKKARKESERKVGSPRMLPGCD